MQQNAQHIAIGHWRWACHNSIYYIIYVLSLSEPFTFRVMNFKAQEAHVCHRNILTVEAENKKWTNKHGTNSWFSFDSPASLSRFSSTAWQWKVGHSHMNLLRFPMASHSRVCIPCRHVTAETSSSGRSWPVSRWLSDVPFLWRYHGAVPQMVKIPWLSPEDALNKLPLTSHDDWMFLDSECEFLPPLAL